MDLRKRRIFPFLALNRTRNLADPTTPFLYTIFNLFENRIVIGDKRLHLVLEFAMDD